MPMRTTSPRTSSTVTTMSEPIITLSPAERLSTSTGTPSVGRGGCPSLSRAGRPEHRGGSARGAVGRVLVAEAAVGAGLPLTGHDRERGPGLEDVHVVLTRQRARELRRRQARVTDGQG